MTRAGYISPTVFQAEPLRYAKTPTAVGESIQGPIALARLDDTIAASGTERLQITCLYSTEAARRRMIDALAPYTAAGPATLTGVPDDTPATLTARLTGVTHQAADLLRHGAHERHARAIPCLTASEGTAVAVPAETDYDPDNPPPPDDAKPLVRQLLGSHDIVSQFLNVNWAPPRPRKRKVGDIIKEIEPAVEPAIAAVRDLLRNAGVIDNRTYVSGPYSSGHNLSGGQWQKLALGRAMRSPEPLLVVLDEPTASLDTHAEHALFERYAEAASGYAAASGTITLLVSHRFATVRMADLIIYLEESHATEAGTYDELIASGGRYAELFTLQASGYR